jgi:hypothetical protein
MENSDDSLSISQLIVFLIVTMAYIYFQVSILIVHLLKETKQYNPKLYSLLSKILKIDPNQLYSESYIKSVAS